ncbi:DUF4255 domain-containing protein [Actinoplanes aureus]|uniref:DUF4255 domain-containing protein n=1 Tax=Actinoplanes aureus TaxID=2792083 RepID=A0A931C3R5_9ACTN|nr:DUF4255 domain-containing protein [Actinoplanes aureus]MBG0562850.1 DUF4255 domain-containing protein [Actinoplanes aureus]
MGDHNVIAEVSEILVAVLDEAVRDLDVGGVERPRAILDDLSGTVANSPPKLTLFLYEIAEDAASRNRGTIRVEPATTNGPVTVRKPPMALVLRYLITAWGGDQPTQQRMLGRALEALYNDAIIDGAQLTGSPPGSLAGSTDALHLTLTPLTLDQKSYVWFALQKPYRLSLNYEVRVVNLDALDRPAAPAVTSRATDAQRIGSRR